MSSTSIIARQVLHKQWADDVRNCNDRPKGMTVDTWCRNHGINTNTYYWRLSALRKACIDMLPPECRETVADETSRFVEVPITGLHIDNKIHSSVSIHIGEALIDLNEDISDEFLFRVMEAAAHVK